MADTVTRKKYLCNLHSCTVDHTVGMSFNRAQGIRGSIPRGFKPVEILHPGDTVMLDEEEWEEFQKTHIEGTLIPYDAKREAELKEARANHVRAQEEARRQMGGQSFGGGR